MADYYKQLGDLYDVIKNKIENESDIEEKDWYMEVLKRMLPLWSLVERFVVYKELKNTKIALDVETKLKIKIRQIKTRLELHTT